MRGLIAASIGVLLCIAFIAVAAPPGPLIKDLGTIYPTPAPTGKPFEKKRLVSTLTVQNDPKGETLVMFEAEDVAKEPPDKKGEVKYNVLASKQYLLSEPPEKLEPLRDKIFLQLRALEAELLEYAEKAGPPKERLPESGGTERPY